MTAGRFSPRSPLRSPLRSRPEQSFREGQVIRQLRRLPSGPAPDPAFVSQLRTEIRAAAVALLAEPEERALDSVPTAVPSVVRGEAAGRPPRRRPPIRQSHRRPVFGLAVAAVLLALLVGLADRWSGPTQSGNANYQVKLDGTHLQLAFAGGDTERGYAFLTLASKRTSAANAFGLSSARPLTDREARLLTQTMGSTDADTRTGMTYLGQAASNARSAAPLAQLGPWITSQHAMLQRLRDQLPTPALQARAAASTALLDRVGARFAALKALAGCTCLSNAKSDDLGPLPCAPCQLGTPAAGTPTPGASGASGSASGRPGTSGSATATATAGAGGGASSGRAAGSASPGGGLPGVTSGNTGGGSGGSAGGNAGNGGGNSGGVSAPASAASPTPSASASGARPTPSAPKPLLPGLSLPVTVGPSGISVGLPGVGIGIGIGAPNGATSAGGGGGGVNITLPVLPPIHLP